MKKLFLFSMMCLMALSMNAQASFPTDAQRCAVLEFRGAQSVSAADVDGISEMFMTYFRPSGYTMIERAQIDKVISEQGFQHSSITDAQAVRLGKILNASKVVVGKVSRLGGQYQVDVRVVDVESGHDVAVEGATFSGDYRTNVRNLATKLANKTASSPSSTTIPEKPVLGFIDLGLPSGTLWKGSNQSGYYYFEDAERIFGGSLPTKEQWEELKAICQWTWTGNGYKITGPNGNSISLPAMGTPSTSYNSCNAGACGSYWSSTSTYRGYNYFMGFDATNMGVYSTDNYLQKSVRLVKK